jgi:hypothetical protein
MRRRRRRGLFALALAALLLAGSDDRTSADTADVLDNGNFTIYVNDARIGEERFVIRQERGGDAGPLFRAGAVQRLKLDGQTMRISVALEATGPRAHPRRYEAELNGGAATTIVGTIVSNRLRLDVRSPAGEEMREFLIRGRAAILDRLIAHQYFFIWKMLGDERSIEINVITPQTRSHDVHVVENTGRETILHDEREVLATHIVLTSETGATRHVWLEGDRLLRVEIPDEGYRAVRSDAVDQTTND